MYEILDQDTRVLHRRSIPFPEWLGNRAAILWWSTGHLETHIMRPLGLGSVILLFLLLKDPCEAFSFTLLFIVKFVRW